MLLQDLAAVCGKREQQTIIHPNVPHVSYKLEKHGLYTKMFRTVGVDPATKEKKVPSDVLEEPPTLKESLQVLYKYCILCFNLNRKRVVLQFIASFLQSYLDALQNKLTENLLESAKVAAETKRFALYYVAKLLAQALFVMALTRTIKSWLAHNQGVISFQAKNLLHIEIMEARHRFRMAPRHTKAQQDLHKLHIKRVSNLLESGYRSSNGLSAVLSVFRHAADLCFIVQDAYSSIQPDLLPVALASFAFEAFTIVPSFIQNMDYESVWMSDKNYGRMLDMFELSGQAARKSDLAALGLSSWIMQQYKQARAKINPDSALNPPREYSDQGFSILLDHQCQDLYKNALTVLVFSYIVSSKRKAGSQLALGKVQDSVASLFLFARKGDRLANSIRDLYVRIKDLRSTATPTRALFNLMASDRTESHSAEHNEEEDLVIYKPIFDNGLRMGMTIEFRNVYFKYPKSTSRRWTLKNVSFSIPAGATCILVGSNGSGKSTCISLLLRLYKPTRGQILINGIDIERYRRQELIEATSVLFQHSSSFPCTIKEFVGVGDVNALNDSITTDRINEALAKSGAKPAVDNLRFGLDSRVENGHHHRSAYNSVQSELYSWFIRDQSHLDKEEEVDKGSEMGSDDEEEAPVKDAEIPVCTSADSTIESKQVAHTATDALFDGTKNEHAHADGERPKESAKAKSKRKKIENEEHPARFSGGEYAKLVLSRHFMRCPDLTVLDEFSSMLDPLSEKHALDALMAEGKNQTMVIVTHRLRMGTKASLILVLDDGKLVESGTHDELLAKNGKYKNLYEADQEDLNSGLEE